MIRIDLFGRYPDCSGCVELKPKLQLVAERQNIAFNSYDLNNPADKTFFDNYDGALPWSLPIVVVRNGEMMDVWDDDEVIWMGERELGRFLADSVEAVEAASGGTDTGTNPNPTPPAPDAPSPTEGGNSKNTGVMAGVALFVAYKIFM